MALLPDPPQLPTQPGGGPPVHTPGDFSAPVPTVSGGSPALHLETSAGLAVPARPAQLLRGSQSTGPKLPQRMEAGGSATHNPAPDRWWGRELGPACWVGPAEHSSAGLGCTYKLRRWVYLDDPNPPPQINRTCCCCC